MSDEEITKALECCGDPYSVCAECPIKDDHGCNEKLANYALDIINRQQAEIEKLESANDEKFNQWNMLAERKKMITLGSLFDGAGTFPFAAQQYGVKTVWASEIEPFPVEVTKKRFPGMKHLGDITKINGADIEPVDIITFGSPCQGLSAAGKRAGLDDERSGLFMEAIRIIKEMRGKTNGEYPKIAVWENVPGAFSSNKGEDFRIVLEELCKIEGGNTSVPRPPKRGGRPVWNDAGLILGDGYSIAWRVLDAQFWGVPQRRRRIFLVADFGGQCAGEILFEREGLSRNFAESRKSWQGFTHSLACRSDAKVWDARGNGDGEICSTITGAHNNRVTDYTTLCVRERCGKEGGGKSSRSISENISPTLACTHGGEPAVCVEGGTITVRRLTPTECGRLQGMPDWWCEDVPHSDTAEYKMWGNGMALPNVLYVMEGVVSLLSARQTDKSHCQVLKKGEKR